MNAATSSTTKPLFRATQVVWYMVGFIEVILLFRFLLKLLGANPGAGFTALIYTISAPFAAPFYNVFGVTQVQGSVFEWAILLGMLVYYLLGWGIVKLFLMGKTVSTPEAARKLEEAE